MSAFPTKRYRILKNDVYAKVVDILKTHNPLTTRPNFTFHQEEGGAIWLKTRTKDIEVLPFSHLLQFMPEKYAGYDFGEGEEAFVKALVDSGLDLKSAEGYMRSVYKFIPEWVVLPQDILNGLSQCIRDDRLFLPPGTLNTAANFSEWLEDIQADDELPTPTPPMDEETKARLLALRTHRDAFNEKYILMDNEIFAGYLEFVRKKPGGTYTKKSGLCEGLLTVRVEGDRIFASAEEFKYEKEFLDDARVQQHLPESLRGFGHGDGPQSLFEACLERRGMTERKAKDIVKQVYSHIHSRVILPTADIDQILQSSSGSVVILSANMILRAMDYKYWLGDD